MCIDGRGACPCLVVPIVLYIYIYTHTHLDEHAQLPLLRKVVAVGVEAQRPGVPLWVLVHRAHGGLAAVGVLGHSYGGERVCVRPFPSVIGGLWNVVMRE